MMRLGGWKHAIECRLHFYKFSDDDVAQFYGAIVPASVVKFENQIIDGRAHEKQISAIFGIQLGRTRLVEFSNCRLGGITVGAVPDFMTNFTEFRCGRRVVDEAFQSIHIRQ